MLKKIWRWGWGPFDRGTPQYMCEDHGRRARGFRAVVLALILPGFMSIAGFGMWAAAVVEVAICLYIVLCFAPIGSCAGADVVGCTCPKEVPHG